VRQVRLQSATTENVVNYTVVVSVENPRGTLLPGMTATVEFLTGSAENTLIVPNAALRFRATPEMMAAAGVSATGNAPRTAADSVAFAARRDSLRKARAAAGGAAGGQGGGQGGAPNGAGATGTARRSSSGSGRPGAAQLWYVDAAGKPAVMRVRTGLSDGQNTQVMGQDVKEGMQVIVGAATTSASTPAATTTSPFQQQRRPGPGGPGGF
jgi:HlyD family secretion protein